MMEQQREAPAASWLSHIGGGLVVICASSGTAGLAAYLLSPAGMPWIRAGLVALVAAVTSAVAFGMGVAVARHRADRVAASIRGAELERLSWRLEFALAASEIGVWDVDLATDQLIWDDQARALFGITDVRPYYSEPDWLGVLHPEDRERALAESNAAITGGRFRTEYRVIRPDGSIRHIRDVASRFDGADGSRRLVGLVWDITADVERQRELEQRRKEAEVAALAKSRFLAAMSHEIRTPLGGVMGLLRLMLEDELAAAQRERATLAIAAAEGLLEILQDILDFSRLEADRIEIRPEAVVVRSLVGEVTTLMAAAAAGKGLTLRADVAPEVPEALLLDPLRLRQVLVNLISNATKFTEAGGIEVALGYLRQDAGDAGRLTVTVRDSGIGIAADQIEQIFEHFVQADNSLSRKAGGTGLGLAISRQLVRLMGGELSVESNPGTGSTFSFSVRASLAKAPASTTPARTRGQPRQRPEVPMRLLLAEDNATNQHVIGACLRAVGHEVEIVDNGAEAVRVASARRFDAILMDVQMPTMDGLTAARSLRGMPGWTAEVPIIALTANALTGDREACLAAGMTDYLPKPIDVSALDAALARARSAAA